jgi:hypothetical protein
MTGIFTLRKSLGLAALAAGLVSLPLAANAAGAAQEISTAADHAGYAAAAGSIDMVHAHMHHALNCLVGAGGTGYDATAIDPCKSQGKGAIPDETDATAKKTLQSIASDLEAGLKDNTLASAQKTAADAKASLEKVK